MCGMEWSEIEMILRNYQEYGERKTETHRERERACVCVCVTRRLALQKDSSTWNWKMWYSNGKVHILFVKNVHLCMCETGFNDNSSLLLILFLLKFFLVIKLRLLGDMPYIHVEVCCSHKTKKEHNMIFFCFVLQQQRSQ